MRMVMATPKVVAASSSTPEGVPRLVTFLGKGGVGKTTSAVLAAQYYSSIGLRTSLVVQSQDVTADYLLGHPLKYSPTVLNDGLLTAYRLETTKMLAERLEQFKKADERVGFSQGAVQEALFGTEKVAGEELSVLPGMDSPLALYMLEQLTGFARLKSTKSRYDDVIVYDGPSTEEILRMFGAAERSRWYMQRFRSVAEKTDLGRLALPSILKLSEAALLEDTSAERSTLELWDKANSILQGVQQKFLNPKSFSSFIVTDPASKLAEKISLRYWGCAMQAGVHVGGFLHHGGARQDESWKESYSPLSVGALPHLELDTPPPWKEIVSGLDEATCQLLEGQGNSSSVQKAPVVFNTSSRTVTCFLPGFDKSEVKLSQPNKSQLLLEAGDQRRAIDLPVALHGKVRGAKFQDKSLVIQLNI